MLELLSLDISGVILKVGIGTHSLAFASLQATDYFLEPHGMVAQFLKVMTLST